MPIVTEAETVEQALRLPDSSRAKLAEKLIASLPSPFVEDDDDWVEESMRRSREMDENSEMSLSHEEFMASFDEYRRK
jgi:Putative addiction module component